MQPSCLHFCESVPGTGIINKGKNVLQEITSSLVTEISFGQNVPQRVGAAIGAAVSPKKSGNRYIGLVWNEYRAGGEKCGAVFQVDEENYTLLLKVLERFTGKQALDSEKP